MKKKFLGTYYRPNLRAYQHIFGFKEEEIERALSFLEEKGIIEFMRRLNDTMLQEKEILIKLNISGLKAITREIPPLFEDDPFFLQKLA